MILRTDRCTVDKGLLNFNAKTFALPHFDNILTIIQKNIYVLTANKCTSLLHV